MSDWEDISESPQQPMSAQKVINPGTKLSEVQQLKRTLVESGKWNSLPKEVKLEITSKAGEMPNMLTGEAMSEEDLANAAASANPVGGMGGKAVKSLGSWLAKKTGLARIPDIAMQVAAGVKKIEPGMGSEMIEQGLVGTRGMMGKQAEKKIPVLAKELEQEVGKLPRGSISHKDVAGEIMDKQRRYQTPSGYVPEADRPAMDAIQQRAGDILTRQVQDPLEALALKKQAGARGWRRDLPLAGLENELNRTEAMAYGKQLSNLGRESELAAANAAEMERMAAMNPEATAVPQIESLGRPSKIEQLNRSQEALFKAKRGADRPDNLMSLMGLLRGGGKLSAPVLSTGAQALTKGSQAGAGLTGLLAPGAAQRLTNSRYLPQQQSEWEDEADWEDVK